MSQAANGVLRVLVSVKSADIRNVMAVDNPRFPHFCRIIRFAEVSPMEDQTIVSDAMSDEVGQCCIGCTCSDCDCPCASAGDGATVIYRGVCRGYSRDTVSDNGDVNASYRWLSLPTKQDEWTEETIPLEGDKVILQRYGYREYGLVVDKRPSNLGTHILWKYVRN